MPPRPLLTITTVSELTGIPADIIMSKSQRADIVTARHMAMYVIRFRYGMTLRWTADALNASSTRSVLHACASLRNKMKADPVIKERVEWLMKVVVY